MSSSRRTWPPLPPEPPNPPQPPRSPWLPEARPPSPGPVTATASLVVGSPDWLAARLLDQRVVALAGELDVETVNRAVAELALLDATGDGPVRLRLTGVSVDLDAALALVDALDLMGVRVEATCVGSLSGPAVAVLAVADTRTAAPHAVLQLSEPRAPRHVGGRELETAAAAQATQLRRLQERLAEACGRPVEEIAADMRAGRVLRAEEAVEYGLADSTGPARSSAHGRTTGN